MKPIQLILRWLRDGCIYFTLMAVILMLFNLSQNNVVVISRFFLLFPAALSISLGGVLFSISSLPRWIRILGHYLITLLAFVLFIWLPTNRDASPAFIFLLLVMVSIIYWISFLLVHLIQKRVRLLLEESKK